ncbi:MAG: hypothetical protein V7751_21805, partial [Pseudoalteromonas distincta]
MPFKQLKKIKSAATFIFSSLLIGQSVQADTLQQRQQYDQAMAALKGGQMQRYESLKGQLRDYPLYPYLLLEALQQRGSAVSHQEMQDFFIAHGDLPTAQRLKNDWLRRLARDGEWRQFRDNYDADSQNAGLECQMAFQRWREGNTEEAMQRAQELWTVGRSQPKDCDPLFDRWRAAGGLTEDVAWARIREALLYRQDALASYLTRYMPSQKALAELFVSTATKPQGLNQ